ncbi:MAG TPA: toll/interleukin-1 receptor domain-containing protein [Ktedonobacteraceae bacterium]|nr:toll/interleukin-1 receptor domain-containing protein [Ktedonobacteraceae bacterium]
MANQEQLELIRQGVEVWNAWRKEHPETKADLSSADLRGADLSQAVFSEAFLSHDLASGINFSHANLSHAHLGKAFLDSANFSRADLSHTNLSGAFLSGAFLNYANLSHANLSHTYLNHTNLSEADLRDAHLSGAKLRSANLSYAYLNRAFLINTDLYRANFFGAYLDGVDISKAIVEQTIFGNVDLRGVKGLETVRHIGPSTVGIDTLLHSEGTIPEIFLRGAGLSDSFIEYARSLTQRPIQYYTCFISYSSKDQDFATRLYADLQSNNVRCWYAPEDMKIGDRIRQRIDESIRIYDKLLLVLSRHSVMSSWMEAEVESALEKERRHNKSVLFPIRLDDAVERTTQAWAAHISQTRHIGDFTRWKEHDAYQRGLKKLLRDLKA